MLHVFGEHFIDQRRVSQVAAPRLFSKLVDHAWINAHRDQLARLFADRRTDDTNIDRQRSVQANLAWRPIGFGLLVRVADAGCGERSLDRLDGGRLSGQHEVRIGRRLAQ